MLETAPSAAGLAPSSFTVTADGAARTVEETVYYPRRRELQLRLAEAAPAAAYRVQADLTDINGGAISLDQTAVAAESTACPLYQDAIKDITIFKDGVPVSAVTEDGSYTVRVRVILQDKTRTEPLTVFLYRDSGGGITGLAQQTAAAYSEDDLLLSIPCELFAGDSVFASLG